MISRPGTAGTRTLVAAAALCIATLAQAQVSPKLLQGMQKNGSGSFDSSGRRNRRQSALQLSKRHRTATLTPVAPPVPGWRAGGTLSFSHDSMKVA